MHIIKLGQIFTFAILAALAIAIVLALNTFASAQCNAGRQQDSTNLNLGLQAGTEESWLTLRGLPTMSIRLERHEKSALHIANWLKGSHLSAADMICVFSVGGGSLEPSISPNLVRALQLAGDVGAGIIGIVGRDGGYTAQVADACVIVPTVNPDTVTPHAEAFQAVVWHLLVSHPALRMAATKWESTP